MIHRSAWSRLNSLRYDLDEVFDLLQRGFHGMRLDEADESETQTVPVNVFETENELMVVAAMPGMEASNIDIRVDDTDLTIRAEKRGPGQERHRYLRREWSYGPYERTIELPMDVDVDKANATYDNGIVTVALPKAAARRTRRIEIQLDQVGSTRGQHVGHRGSAEAAAATAGGKI
jgi:HSP20 family protein